MLRVFACCFLGGGGRVKLLGRIAASDSIVFYSGELSVRVRQRLKLIPRQVEADIAIEVAVNGIAWITRLRTPDLTARFDIARESSRPWRSEARRKRAASRWRARIAKSVGVEDEPTNILLLQQLIDSRGVAALR